MLELLKGKERTDRVVLDGSGRGASFDERLGYGDK
jgi:hypothetical protein